MPHATNTPLAQMIEKLAINAPLSEDDRAAILSLPHTVRPFEPGSYIVRDADRSLQCYVLVSGFTFRHKISENGQRQIVSIQLPGEILDLQNLYLDTADHNVQTLTRSKAAAISRNALRALTLDRPAIGTALFTSSMVEASMYREWMLNIGRRDARARLAHLLCEFAARLDVQGIAPGQPYGLPMTQEQLGDALGLTAVHINRTLRSLQKDRLISYTNRGITFPDWSGLKEVAGFNTRYLHLSGPGVS